MSDWSPPVQCWASHLNTNPPALMRSAPLLQCTPLLTCPCMSHASPACTAPQTEEHSDEKVLSSLPSTVRRRLLRHLYLAPLQRCYLFKCVKQKLLEALLAAGRVELYMPHVEVRGAACAPGEEVERTGNQGEAHGCTNTVCCLPIARGLRKSCWDCQGGAAPHTCLHIVQMLSLQVVSEGDHVNDLYILLNGTMEVLLPRPVTSINLSAFSATVAALEGGALTAGGGGGGGRGRVSDSANNSLHGAHRKQVCMGAGRRGNCKGREGQGAGAEEQRPCELS